MTGPNTGLRAQRVAASLRNYIARKKRLELGEIVNAGLDGGREFSFVIGSSDGTEMIVSVIQTKDPPIALPERLEGYTPANLAARQAELKQQRCVQAQERRRKKFLGEI